MSYSDWSSPSPPKLIISRPPTPDNTHHFFTLFPLLPPELQIIIWKFAASSRLWQGKHDPIDYTQHYSADREFCYVAKNYYASRPLSIDTPTRIYIANKLLRELKGQNRLDRGSPSPGGGRDFYGLLTTSRMARISALEFWKQSVEKFDVYKEMHYCNYTEEAIESLHERGRRKKERLVRVLEEMVGLVGASQSAVAPEAGVQGLSIEYTRFIQRD